MSRSPWCSPVGKRLRTMEDTDSSDEDPDTRDAFFLKYADGEFDKDRIENMEITVTGASDDDKDDRSGDEDDIEGESSIDIDSSDSENDDEEDDEDIIFRLRDETDNGEIDYDTRSSLDSSWVGVDHHDDVDFVNYSEDDIERCLPEEYLKHDPTPETQYPQPDWITLKELHNRRLGFASTKRQSVRTNFLWFERYAKNSLWMIQRLQRRDPLEEHIDCINSINFNSSGQLLCSGGDDLDICIWDWQKSKLKNKLTSGHMNNILHSQFCHSDEKIITSSKDGTVRLLVVETGQSDMLISQFADVGKLAFTTPQTIVTCSTNACVSFIDLRMRGPARLFIVRNPKDNNSCALHTIDVHPLDKHKVVVGGRSPHVFLYDLRRVALDPKNFEHKPTYCFERYDDAELLVTSTAFNSTGDKLLISYCDDDLLLCKTDTCEVVHTYKGHRNSKTIKECTWFGDNFVMSGSDDGHIYGWDVESEHIVCFLNGDDKGIVNCLSVHPTLPILASSGLDQSVKIWEPTSQVWPQTLKGIKPQICKNSMRRKRAKEIREYSRRFLQGPVDESDTD